MRKIYNKNFIGNSMEGNEQWVTKSCWACNGNGYIKKLCIDKNGDEIEIEENCDICGGLCEIDYPV